MFKYYIMNQVIFTLDIEDFSTPKPERFIQQIIHLGSNENDIVMDFYIGSATAQAVSYKMNRQYIGVEQMDYMNKASEIGRASCRERVKKWRGDGRLKERKKEKEKRDE